MNDPEARRAYLSLGSNLGSREETLARAIAAIGATPGVTLLHVSSLYATDPVGYLDQPEFLNCAIEIETTLAPDELLARVRAIELELGRAHRERWREREIDIDIVLFGRETVEREELTVPHRELHRRRFVLLPLSEIAPDAPHPVLRRSVRDLLDQCTDPAGARRVRPDNPQLDALFPS